MKITFVMPGGGLTGGIRVIAIHAAGLAARGHEVTVVWHRRPAPSWRVRLRAWSRLRRLRPPEQGCSLFDEMPVRQIMPSEPRYITDADVPDGDVVIATWWETAFEVAALAPGKGEKFYFVQHHEVHEHLPHHISRGSYRLPLHKITISQWLVDVMAADYGDHDVDLIENSVDTGLFHAGPREKNAAPVVGLMYSPVRFKGLDVSLAAIARARRKVPDLRVVAFGKEGPVPSLPLPEGTTYFQNPAQEKLREIYAMCDVWLCGSRAEGFHLPPLEAMACRTPVVSTRVGGPMDTIEDGTSGFLVDVEDAEALGRRLVDVARMTPEAWRVMSDAAHVRATSYGWDDATDLFEAALLRRLGIDSAAKRGGGLGPRQRA